MLAYAVLLILYLFVPEVHAQVAVGAYTATNGTWSYPVLITGSSPPSGYTANREYWQFATAAWPSGDFDLVPASSASPTPSFTYTHTQPFPTGWWYLPCQVGTVDKVYAISICPNGPPLDNCENAGVLIVRGESVDPEYAEAELEWFKHKDWGSGVFTAPSGGWLHFDKIAAPPGTNDQFYHIQQAPL